MSNTETKLPPGQFANESERLKYEMDPANFEKLDPATQARVATLKFNSGQFMGVAETKIIEAGIPGANGDGILSKEELQKLDDMRNDKAFFQGMEQAGGTMLAFASVGAGFDHSSTADVYHFSSPEAHDFESEGGIKIKAPSISHKFEAAAAGTDLPEPDAPEQDNVHMLENDGLDNKSPAFKKSAPAYAYDDFGPSPPSM